MKKSLPKRGARVGVVLSFLFAGIAPLLAASDSDPIGESALRQIQALLQQKLERTAAQKKMDSQLVYALNPTRFRQAAPDMVTRLDNVEGGLVLLDIDAVIPKARPEDPGGVPEGSVLRRIQELGGTVVNSFRQFRAVRAYLPLAGVESLAEHPDVKFVALAREATTNTGSVTGEGDVTHRAAATRNVFGVTGAGVNVGVMSDSVDFLAASQGLGDLPAVTVLPGQSGVPASGEGTAMLEIVADVAPGANLFYATAFNGQASMAANILALQAAGCDIIVDDVTYFAESPFQDGVISQAVNTVSAAGVLYFSSARNSGNLNDGTSGTWEGDFADGGAVGPPIPGSGRLHSFGGSTFDTVTANNRWRLDLFWADPLGGSGNDYDVFVLNSTGAAVMASSTNVQSGSQDPYESISGMTYFAAIGDRVVIVKANAAADRFLHLDTGRGRLSIGTNGNVRGHNASGAPNAFSVAATDVSNSDPSPFTGGATNPVEQFSSDGPRRMFFNPAGAPFTPGNFTSTGGIVLQKPDITAADGAVSSAALPGVFNPFFGTSAAAPHAAAIAALLLSFAPTPTPAAVRAALVGSALDIEAPGFDRDSGVGVVMAFGAMKLINPCTVTCPAGPTVGNDPDQCAAAVSFALPSTVGGCGIPPTTCSPSSGSSFPVGSTSVTCTTASEDSCSFTVQVNDSQPPSITCPANRTVPNDPGLCSAVVSFAPTVSDNCPGVGSASCVPPSGSTFPKGVTPVNCAVQDAADNPSNCGFSVTVNDTEKPRVFCSVAQDHLWPPNHNMVAVGLTVSATDNCAGPLPITLGIFGDENDEMPSGDGRFSPDAKDIAPGTLRLRRERRGDADGRVYLEVSSTTDGSMNSGFACCTTVVPHSPNGAGITSVDLQAAAAQSFCSVGGTAPPGYFVVGDGPIIGPKQ